MIFVRIFGKKEIGQIAPNDLVLLLLISNAVQNAMVGADQSVPGGLAAVGTLLALNFLLTFLASLAQGFSEHRRRKSSHPDSPGYRCFKKI